MKNKNSLQRQLVELQVISGSTNNTSLVKCVSSRRFLFTLKIKLNPLITSTATKKTSSLAPKDGHSCCRSPPITPSSFLHHRIIVSWLPSTKNFLHTNEDRDPCQSCTSIPLFTPPLAPPSYFVLRLRLLAAHECGITQAAKIA